KYSVFGNHNQPVDDKELNQFMAHYVVLLSSFKEQLQQHVRVHAMEAIATFVYLYLISILGVAPGEGTGATMSDDDEEQVESDANLFDGGLDVSDSMGFGLPTESERSLMERVRQELKHELKQGYKEKIVDIREEILRKRRAGKLPGDTTSLLKAWWQSHSKWPYPTSLSATALWDAKKLRHPSLVASPFFIEIGAGPDIVFSTSKKFDYPPLVSNVGWLGLLSVARLGGQRALGCGGAIIAQFPNLMRHRVRTAGNRSMGGLRILLPPQGWLIVRSRLEDPWFWKAHESERYVECATDTRDHQAALSLYRDRGGIAQFFLEEGWFARGDRSTSFPIALGLCLDLPCAKSKGLVPMEIPLGLIPRLMTKGESAWRKVKIGGSREKFPSGVFRRSEGIQCPTTDSSRNCVIGAEPGMAVSGHPPSPVREALFNTLRKDVHRGQKDSVIGT
ncbi:homeobox protein knotted-1-like LET12 isoform X1, partial [Tanacetum coccineum]